MVVNGKNLGLEERQQVPAGFREGDAPHLAAEGTPQ
jgi:hypothetical protein